jgi:hypothetical protein
VIGSPRAVGVAIAVAALACTRAQKPVVRETPPVASSTLGMLYSGTGSYADRALLRTMVGVGPSARKLLGRDFAPTQEGTSQSAVIEIPGSGELPVRVALISAAGDTLATARVVLALHPNWSYDLMLMAGGSRLEGMCMGQVTAVPIRPAGVDTLFVYSGGLPKGSMC